MKKNDSKITNALVLTVFAAFAVCILLVLLYGAGVYRNLAHRGEENFHMRTAVQYVNTRVRQAESVEVVDFDGCQALSIREQIDGQWYVTRVYYYDGYIRELFCAEDAALSPQDGEKIIHAESLHFRVDEDLLTTTLDNQVFYLYLQGKEGGRI